MARIGDQFLDLFAVRCGSFKSYTTDVNGREHVQNFFLPGQLIGLDVVETGQYRSNIMALETSGISRISYAALTTLFAKIPNLTGYILRLMSRALAANEILSGDYDATERCVAFLTGLGEYYGGLGWSPNVFNLTMSRRDIANHLRLAPETVSRVFTHLASDGLIEIKGREVTLVDRQKLDGMASCIGPLRV